MKNVVGKTKNKEIPSIPKFKLTRLENLTKYLLLRIGMNPVVGLEVYVR
jgi:hypothetical protein